MKKIFIAFTILAWAALASAAAPTGSLLDGVKPGADGRIDVLTIFPHQDDETIFVGGTILALKQDPRVRVHIMCLTLGDKSRANKILHITPDFQGKVRSRELRAAAAVLGADEVIQLDYRDQGLPGADQKELYAQIADAMGKTNAEVVITYGPEGITGHMDHKAGSKAVTEVFKTGPAQKLYYVSMPRWVHALAFPGVKLPVAPTVKVDIRPYKELKLLAMDEHATQKWWAGLFQQMTMENEFNDEYFALALSK